MSFLKNLWSSKTGLKSEELFERSKKVVPGGVHSPVRSFKGMDRSPIFFEKAEGAFLTSVEGDQYVDFCMSFGPMILGHQDPDVKEEVHRMVDTAWTFGACEKYSLELAEWMNQNLPHVEKLRFVSSGTEAVMSALRLGRAATGRTKVLKFDGCYHGHVDSLLVKAGSGLAGTTASSSAGISDAVAAETLICPLDDLKTFEEIMSREGKNIAIVAIEPLPANYGLLIQTEEYLKKIQQITHQHGALLLLDEVISGFRIGLGGMTERYGLKPDLVCYGKIIGGGFPVGCYGGRADLLDVVAPLGPVYQAGTLSANPIGMRAGLVSLQKMKKLNGWKVLQDRTEMFSQKIQSGFDKNNLPLQISKFDSLFWIHEKTTEPLRRVDKIPATQSGTFKKLFLRCLNEKIYLAPNAYEVGFVSLAHDESLLEECADLLVKEACASFR